MTFPYEYAIQSNNRFIEEPTAPDDILGHAAIRKALKPYGIGVATGEHAHNRMVFKQLLQAEAIDVCQIDSCRLAGVSEVLSVLLMAAKYVLLLAALAFAHRLILFIKIWHSSMSSCRRRRTVRVCYSSQVWIPGVCSVFKPLTLLLM